MSSDPSSHISRAVRLLLERAPAADASDTIVEKWGRYVVQLLNGVKTRQPEFLSLPEIVSVVDLLQDLADARLKVAWLEWGGDWLPGTVIEQCLSQLPIANDSAPSQPSASSASHAPPTLVSATYRVKRGAPNEASSSERHAKRVRHTASIYTLESTKDRLLKDQLDIHLLREPRKVLHKCGSCENGRAEDKLCLTVTKKGVIQNRCARCIMNHLKCEWKKGHFKENQAYREESSSSYDPVGNTGSSKGTPVPHAYSKFVIDIPSLPVTTVRPPCGPKSVIRQRSSGLHIRTSLPPPHDTPTLPKSPFVSSIVPTPPSLTLPPPDDMTIPQSEITASAGDAQPAKNGVSVEAMPGSSLPTLCADAAVADAFHLSNANLEQLTKVMTDENQRKQVMA